MDKCEVELVGESWLVKGAQISYFRKMYAEKLPRLLLMLLRVLRT